MVTIFCSLAIISFSLALLAVIWYFIETNCITDSPRIDFIESLILGLLGITSVFLALALFLYFLN